MKKIVCVCLSLLFLLLPLSAGAVPLSAGDDALRASFGAGSAGGLDFRFFEPQTQEGKTYPLVVWLHGIASGNYAGDQVDSYDFCKWASDEYQARFSAGGAYLLCPRCPGGWEVLAPSGLKNCIDGFMSQHPGKIDAGRIYVIGFSVGAVMVIRTVAAYPDYFAAAIPVSAVTQLQPNVEKMDRTAVWFFANDRDAYVGANSAATRSSYNTLKGRIADADKLRFTWVTSAVYPDYGNVATQHYMWRIVTNDYFMNDNAPYANATTLDGSGAVVSFTYPEGVISWLNRQSRPAAQPGSGQSMSFLSRIIAFFRNLFAAIARLFS